MKIITIMRSLFFVAIALVCSNSFANTATDAAITQSIQNQIAANNTVSGLKIAITTQESNVALVGTVNTDDEASTIIQIAESTTGVNNVDTSKLMVKESKQPFADTVITAKVKGTFIREKLFGTADVPVTSINVETKNGVVYLSGTVENAMQAQNAVNLTKTVDGVKSVQSTITVVKNQ